MAAVQVRPVPRVLSLLMAGLFFLALASGARHNIEIVFPRRVHREQAESTWRNARGRTARDAEGGPADTAAPQDFVFYRMDAFGKTLLLRLTPNKEFLSRSFQTLTLGGDGRIVDLSESTGACFYSGTVESFRRSSVVLSTCSGLMGLIKVNNEQMLIEPLSQRRRHFSGRPHRIYRRELPQASATQFCGTETDQEKSEVGEGSRPMKRSAVNNVDARQRTIEALVVLDKSIVKHHGRAIVKTYALTVMSMVNSVISLPSIGHNINIAVTRLVILEEDQEGLRLVHHADSALHNFCRWQREKLPYVSAVDTDTNEVIGHRGKPNRHDAAILLTRKDICKDRDEPCGTLGMAFISGMCDPNRMCSVNEDNGLTLAFTVAHELGHNLGMNHDGMENRCVTRPESSVQYIMSSSWLRRTGKVNLQWSQCSRRRAENFLRSKQSQCLLDTKGGANLKYADELPGELYTADQQCVFIFGKNASVCPYPEKKFRLCESLWCIEPGEDECVTKEFAAVDGTECGNDKWCKGGRCEYNKDPVHGGWGNWTRWSGCSRTCGTGVRFAARKCDNPFPKYGGTPCGGDRVTYEVCNTQPCPEGSPTFRSEQCASYRRQHARANKTRSSFWYPVYSEENPCALLCRPVSGLRRTAVTLSDRVIDGTPCSPGKRALCVDGQCKRVGCDDVIGSDAEEDKCGVCLGNGTTCHLVRGMYKHQHGTGYEEIVVVPRGARRIRVMEARPMRSYLAMKDSATKRYVNGGKRIELPGTFNMADTKVQYTRKDLWEMFTAEGPINNSLQFLILHQDPAVAVMYEYTMDLENATYEESPTVNNYKITNDLESFREDVPTHGWIPDGWEDCDAVCGGGVRRGRSRCMELLIQNRSLTFVDDEPCRDLPKPWQKEETCNKGPCETKWRTAGWRPCSVTCGEGTHRRVVACTHQLSNGTLRSTQPEQCDGTRPPSEKPCRLKSCPLVASRWKESHWSECSVTCGGGIQSRLVRCVGRASDGSERYVGEAQCQVEKPAVIKECGNRSCEHSYEWQTEPWTPCSASCGPGEQLRNASCVDPLDNDTDSAVPEQHCSSPKPQNIRNCTYGECPIKKWETSAWAGCSVSCGQGMQSREVTCMTSYTNGTVLTGDDLCEIPKPHPVRSCGFEPCPISESWEATSWHACSVTCGQGIRSRRVRCKVTFPNGTMLYAPDVRCNDTEKPRTLKPCFGMECAAKPIEIVWSKCSSKCGPGVKTRRVKCLQNDVLCKLKYRTTRKVECYGSKCSGVWKTGPWSKCSVTCGYGLQYRSIRCKTDRTDKTWFHNCNKHDRPGSTRSCYAGSCVNAFDLYVYPLQPPIGRPAKEPRRCTRDRANPRICRVVKNRGRLCRHTHWAKNCCKTCGYYEVV